MDRRSLDLRDFDAVARDVDSLLAKGYRRAGNWDLAQICDHLSMTMEGSINGFSIQVPWLVRKLVAPIFYRRIVMTRRLPAGRKGPASLMPKPGGDPGEAVRRFKEWLGRVGVHKGDFELHPFFGYLTPEEWRDLHLMHTSHHLSFLIPSEAAPTAAARPGAASQPVEMKR